MGTRLAGGGCWTWPLACIALGLLLVVLPGAPLAPAVTDAAPPSQNPDYCSVRPSGGKAVARPEFGDCAWSSDDNVLQITITPGSQQIPRDVDKELLWNVTCAAPQQCERLAYGEPGIKTASGSYLYLRVYRGCYGILGTTSSKEAWSRLDATVQALYGQIQAAPSCPLPAKPAREMCDLLPASVGVVSSNLADVSLSTGGLVQGKMPTCGGFVPAASGQTSTVVISRYDTAAAVRQVVDKFQKDLTATGQVKCDALNVGEFGYTCKSTNAAQNVGAFIAWGRGCFYVNAAAQPEHVGAKASEINTQIDAKLKTMPPCPSGGAAPAAQPEAAGTFGVGHGCSYNAPQYPGQVFCAATYTNAPSGATVEYQWTFDGESPVKGDTFSRQDESIAPGAHTITVAARDTKNNKQASSSYTFTKAGADLYVTVQCALRSGDDRAVACYADPKNAPEGTTLAFEWTWSGVREGESGRTLSKANLADGMYNISVRARDSKSGKYTQAASTSITVGKAPSWINVEGLAAGITSVLTGTPLPNAPDPAAAAAAGATIAALLGLGGLANALSSAGGAKAQMTGAGAGTQPASGTDADATSAGAQTATPSSDGRPDTVPEETRTPVAGQTVRPTTLPEGTPAGQPTTVPEQKPATSASDENKVAGAGSKTDKLDSGPKTATTETLRFFTDNMGDVDWPGKPSSPGGASDAKKDEVGTSAMNVLNAPTDYAAEHGERAAQAPSPDPKQVQELNRRIADADKNARDAEWRSAAADERIARAEEKYQQARMDLNYWEDRFKQDRASANWKQVEQAREQVERTLQEQRQATEALKRAAQEAEEAQARADELSQQLDKLTNSGDPTPRGGAK